MGTWFLLDEDTPQSSRSWRWWSLLCCFSHLFPDYQLLPRGLGSWLAECFFPRHCALESAQMVLSTALGAVGTTFPLRSLKRAQGGRTSSRLS